MCIIDTIGKGLEEISIKSSTEKKFLRWGKKMDTYFIIILEIYLNIICPHIYLIIAKLKNKIIR